MEVLGTPPDDFMSKISSESVSIEFIRFASNLPLREGTPIKQT